MSNDPARAPGGLTQTAPSGEAHEAQYTDDGPTHVPRHLGLALVVIAAAQLMIVLDATIVNVALPHIQMALGFTGAGLEWIITAYSLAFGSLLLLGGRLGDIYGRRRIFIIGIGLFAGASFVGGFATTEWWLLAARAFQGAGAALAAPTALALIATTFPMGRERNRALGVWAGMAGAGGAVGLLLGGILTTYVSWRWVLFVNAPIAIVVIILAPFALVATPRLPKRLDIPGVITSTAGLALLVYGLTHAAAGQDGVSHWSNPVTIGCLVVAVALLVAFFLIERSVHEPELPLHLLKSRRRSGGYLISLISGTAMFAVFFFLTLYIQVVWGYSAIRAGLAWLPFPITMITLNLIVARYLVAKIGVRPLLLAGPLIAGIGLPAALAAEPDGQLRDRHPAADGAPRRRHGLHVRADDPDGRGARAARRGRRRLEPAQHRAAGGRFHRARRHRHHRVDDRGEHDPPESGRRRGGRRAAAAAARAPRPAAPAARPTSRSSPATSSRTA